MFGVLNLAHHTTNNPDHRVTIVVMATDVAAENSFKFMRAPLIPIIGGIGRSHK